MSLTNFYSTCSFYDAINFPHGFDRSGVFTRNEANMLTNCGYVIKQLTEGRLEPENVYQTNMLLVIRNEIPASTEIEKLWLKYLNSIEQRKVKPLYLSSVHFNRDAYEDDLWTR